MRKTVTFLFGVSAVAHTQKVGVRIIMAMSSWSCTQNTIPGAGVENYEVQHTSRSWLRNSQSTKYGAPGAGNIGFSASGDIGCPGPWIMAQERPARTGQERPRRSQDRPATRGQERPWRGQPREARRGQERPRRGRHHITTGMLSEMHVYTCSQVLLRRGYA